MNSTKGAISPLTLAASRAAIYSLRRSTGMTVQGYGIRKAPGRLEFSRRTLQRWRKSVSGQDGCIDALHFPPNKLTDLERQHIINIAN
ncbi:MAG: hypothetical protein JKY45_10005, partial [Emcibacter sp.]|nr:hypothetical protein [Emcibacter sp.]